MPDGNCGFLYLAVQGLLVTVSSLCQVVQGLLVTVGSLCQAVRGLLVNCRFRLWSRNFTGVGRCYQLLRSCSFEFPQNMDNQLQNNMTCCHKRVPLVA